MIVADLDLNVVGDCAATTLLRAFILPELFRVTITASPFPASAASGGAGCCSSQGANRAQKRILRLERERFPQLDRANTNVGDVADVVHTVRVAVGR